MLTDSMAWPGVALLGAWHGINPGMGWLFAVALGLQQGGRRAVWQALPPLALGHALAILVVVLLAAGLQLVMSVTLLRWITGMLLVAFGAWKLVTARHPRYGGMLISPRELTVWSALMAAAHGAGLMVVPFVLGQAHAGTHAHAGHLAAVSGSPGAEAAILATVVHTVAYLLAACGVAFLVYERLGVSVIKRLWVNIDRIWAVTLVVTGVLTPLL